MQALCWGGPVRGRPLRRACSAGAGRGAASPLFLILRLALLQFAPLIGGQGGAQAQTQLRQGLAQFGPCLDQAVDRLGGTPGVEVLVVEGILDVQIGLLHGGAEID